MQVLSTVPSSRLYLPVLSISGVAALLDPDSSPRKEDTISKARCSTTFSDLDSCRSDMTRRRAIELVSRRPFTDSCSPRRKGLVTHAHTSGAPGML